MDEIQVGEKAAFSKTVSETDVYLFAGITGDMNPVHVNREFAAETPFRKPIAHGVLGLGLISNVLGTQLPGPGSIYVQQSIKFTKPVYVGDTITAMVEVIEKDAQRNKVRLRTWCQNQDGVIVMDGEALMMPRKEVSRVDGGQAKVC
ncbi:MaoC domain protein dehydratase [Syntrophothermus lipocalidus DSM 12680]|uniref:MaoC domain protein dehydratase n=2 Tax=Syntrophomonadaceae TaxID=68298 RepID=D7CIV9_SYNLT|nr:MaoC domain protein dehydratase [Syntrophothermus lipocalidus DSM 12680]